jgi:hypothetical protein
MQQFGAPCGAGSRAGLEMAASGPVKDWQIH